MAKVMFILASVLIFVVAFSHAVNSVEGRHLKIGKTKVSNKKPITPTEKTETASRKLGENTSTFRGDHASKTMAHVANEFKAAALVDIKHNETTNPGVPLDDSRSPPPGHIEDFRPTAPGHSPGIGHSVHN
ncbi:precursor of CEP9-like [Macadamia integrifolia]|uniref:precursor of CEP9-like n=1 Tax=Macadamia integrifolia TaxID=60698 RepID=UPI001C4FDF1D|nr:precursor of CEP9-like [Macadamia integrifolia]